MNIRIKEPLYITENGQDFLIRQGASGVVRNNIVYFYDNTKTKAVGFSREFCESSPPLFQIERAIRDKEVSVKQIVQVIETMPHEDLPQKEILRILVEKIKTL